MISSVRSSNPFLRSRFERLNEAHQILVRLDITDVEHEPVVELIALPHPGDRVLRRRDAEAFVDGVVDDDDFIGRNVEEVDDVTL